MSSPDPNPATQLADGIVAIVNGISVPAAPHFGPRMIASMQQGRYERGEIACALATIPRGSRILELGAGSGIVGAVIALNCAPAAILAVEANPALLPHARALYARNAVDHLVDLRHGVVLTAPDAPDRITFHIRGNFLGSGLAPLKQDRARPVSVPVLRHAEICRSFPHAVIVMDIEGGELQFLRHADLSRVALLVAEMHPAIYGRDGLQECRALLATAGLEQDMQNSQAGVHVYRRIAG